MKVILLSDVDKIGKKFDLKEIKNGYARNFLIPKGLAKPATKEALEWLKIQKEMTEKKAEESLKVFQQTVSTIDGQEVIVSVKVGEEGQLFESVTAQKISDKLKEMGFDVKKSQISLESPIKEVGEFPVKIKFEHNLEAEVTVVISEEKE
jgi:large subunit ribosomal protein L9